MNMPDLITAIAIAFPGAIVVAVETNNFYHPDTKSISITHTAYALDHSGTHLFKCRDARSLAEINRKLIEEIGRQPIVFDMPPKPAFVALLQAVSVSAA